MNKEEKLIEAMMGLGLARVCLKKALAALVAAQAESDLPEITKDYIMEANANYLYPVENTLGEVLKAERGACAAGDNQRQRLPPYVLSIRHDKHPRMKSAAPGTANTRDGKGGDGTACSASSVNENKEESKR